MAMERLDSFENHIERTPRYFENDILSSMNDRTDNCSTASYFSYAPSNLEHDDDGDVGGFTQHRLRKLSATTRV